jgi:uncharacterized membrane protein
MKWKDFLICGLAGWCMEIVFTALGSFSQNDLRFIGNTSLWMFPIYGMASLIGPIYEKIGDMPTILRSLIYGVCIMLGEFVSGSILRLFAACPWDYSNALYNFQGLVRLDYLPFWMAAGLVFERLICRQGTLLSHRARN